MDIEDRNHHNNLYQVSSQSDSDKNDDSNPQQGSVDSVTVFVNKDKDIQKIHSTTKDPRKIFVGGLPPDITNDEFHSYFTQFGEVLDSVVMFDRETKRSRGFGFVTFIDPAVCDHLLSLGGGGVDDGTQKLRSGKLDMRGKVIEIKEAEPKQQTGSTHRRVGRGNFPSYPVGNSMNPNYVTSQLPIDACASMWLQFPGPYPGYPQNDNNLSLAYPYPVVPGFATPMYFDNTSQMNQVPIMLPVGQNHVTQISAPDGSSYHNIYYAYDFHYQTPLPVANPSGSFVGVLPSSESSVMQPLAPGIARRVDDSLPSKEHQK